MGQRGGGRLPQAHLPDRATSPTCALFPEPPRVALGPPLTPPLFTEEPPRPSCRAPQPAPQERPASPRSRNVEGARV